VGDGVTPNDLLDPDLGPNLLQNFAILSSAYLDGVTQFELTGTINTLASQSFTLEFYYNDSSTRNGQTFFNAVTVTTDASGNASFSFISPLPLTMQYITALAIQDSTGNTSEFAAPIAITARPPTPPTPPSDNTSQPLAPSTTLVDIGEVHSFSKVLSEFGLSSNQLNAIMSYGFLRYDNLQQVGSSTSVFTGFEGLVKQGDRLGISQLQESIALNNLEGSYHAISQALRGSSVGFNYRVATSGQYVERIIAFISNDGPYWNDLNLSTREAIARTNTLGDDLLVSLTEAMH
jgi:hypothetical protein